MSKKKASENQGLVLSEIYVPATLPKYGFKLDTFIPSDYSLTLPNAIEDYYKACEEKLDNLVKSSDEFTDGSVCDSYIDAQVMHLRCNHEAEVVTHQLQCGNIMNARNNRKAQLERRKADLEEKIQDCKQKIVPLAGLHSQFEAKLGPFRISLGLIVTILALVVDYLVNYSYLQSILLQNQFLLMVCTVCLAIMSDVSMFCLGTLISRKEEKFTSTWLYRIITAGLLSMFLISVVAGVMVRFGSMDQTFGSINAAGVFIGKESYSMAEWGVSLVTAFLTTATGLISFAMSVDKNAHLVDRRRGYEATLNASEAELRAVCAELAALDSAVDPYELDKQYQAVADKAIEALQIGLKMHVRKLLAEKQADPSYTESVSQSCDALVPKKAPMATTEEGKTSIEEKKEDMLDKGPTLPMAV